MSASDAAPLPRDGEVFFDVRGESRTMRVSWYSGTGVAVFSIWQGGTCTGTFRLPIPELPRMIEALSRGPSGSAGVRPRTAEPGPWAADPGPPAATAGTMAGGYAQSAGHARRSGGYRDDGSYTGDGHGDSGYRDDDYDGEPAGYPDDGYDSGYGSYGDAPHGQEVPARGYEDGYGDPRGGYGDAPGRYNDPRGGYGDDSRGYGDDTREYGDAPPGRRLGTAPARGHLAPADYQDLPRQGEPGAAGYATPGHLHGGHSGPSGPLPVGQWREDGHGDQYLGADPLSGDYGGEDDGYLPGPATGEDGEDPLSGDYGGEAEEGYLPGPPTESFSPVASGGGHDRPDVPGYSSYATPEGPDTQALPYPDQADAEEWEYRASHGRS